MLSHRAILTGCINGEFPDLYGHYREARYSQMKHHWWWKTNFVFSNIRILQNYDGIFDLASLNENFQSKHKFVKIDVFKLNVDAKTCSKALC